MEGFPCIIFPLGLFSYEMIFMWGDCRVCDDFPVGSFFGGKSFWRDDLRVGCFISGLVFLWVE